jgi:hypothetical protein
MKQQDTGNPMKLVKIISGGQTGADNAALDAAIDSKMDYGGAIPRGRKTAAGPLAAKYKKMTELESPLYRVRTKQNVLTADGTLIFTYGNPSGGTGLTVRLAQQHAKPFLVVDLEMETAASAAALITAWLKKANPAVLNVAGPRESEHPGTYQKVFSILQKVLPRKRGS